MTAHLFRRGLSALAWSGLSLWSLSHPPALAAGDPCHEQYWDTNQKELVIQPNLRCCTAAPVWPGCVEKGGKPDVLEGSSCAYRETESKVVYGKVYNCDLPGEEPKDDELETLATGTSCVNKVLNEYLKGGKSLKHIVNLSKKLGCKNQVTCTVERVIRTNSKQFGVPLDVVRALFWTESSWRHWKPNLVTPIHSVSDDWGIAQINGSWKKRVAKLPKHFYTTLHAKPAEIWSQMQNDLFFNMRLGMLLYKDAMGMASKKYSGMNLYRSAYGIYNQGPSGRDRPFKNGGHPHDKNFYKNYNNKVWGSAPKGCQ